MAFFANSADARETPLTDAPQAASGFLLEESLQSVKQEPLPDLGLVDERIISAAWEDIYRILDGVDLTAPPVLRLLKGHAALATNHNNESMCLFLGTRDEASIESWKDWTGHLATDTLAARILYLRADSLARAGDRAGALVALEEAITHATGMDAALSHNAFGVLLASTDPRSARVAFDEAIGASNGRLADAHANIGSLRIQLQEGARAAREAFQRARDMSNNAFLLAEHSLLWLDFVQNAPDMDLSSELPPSPMMLGNASSCNMSHPITVANWRYILSLAPFDVETREQLVAAILPGTTIDSAWSSSARSFRDLDSLFNQTPESSVSTCTASQAYSEPLLDRPLNWLGKVSHSNWIGRNRSGGAFSYQQDTTGEFPLGPTDLPGNFYFDRSARSHDIQYWVDQHVPRGTEVQVKAPDGGFEYYEPSNTLATNSRVILDAALGLTPVSLFPETGNWGRKRPRTRSPVPIEQFTGRSQEDTPLHSQPVAGVIIPFEKVDTGDWAIQPAYGLCYLASRR
jgi:tetratricopeptide (TPR) repeat protein